MKPLSYIGHVRHLERQLAQARKALKEAMAKYKEQANYSVETADFWQRWVKALGEDK